MGVECGFNFVTRIFVVFFILYCLLYSAQYVYDFPKGIDFKLRKVDKGLIRVVLVDSKVMILLNNETNDIDMATIVCEQLRIKHSIKDNAFLFYI